MTNNDDDWGDDFDSDDSIDGIPISCCTRNEHLACSRCGYTVWWQRGNYLGEKQELAEHQCTA